LTVADGWEVREPGFDEERTRLVVYLGAPSTVAKMSMKKVNKGAKGAKSKGKDKEPEDESYAHVLAMNWQW